MNSSLRFDVLPTDDGKNVLLVCGGVGASLEERRRMGACSDALVERSEEVWELVLVVEEGPREAARLSRRDREERDLVSSGLCSSSSNMPTLMGSWNLGTLRCMGELADCRLASWSLCAFLDLESLLALCRSWTRSVAWGGGKVRMGRRQSEDGDEAG